MKISIAMATYNGERFLQEQLDSFVAQSRLPDELVVSDDCSTDGTLEILERFAKEAPFEVIINKNKNNLGYAGNFNRALELTTGDLVFLSDQDDVWFDNKIEVMCNHASNTDKMVLLNDAVITDTELKDTGVTQLGQIKSGNLPESLYVLGCSVLIKRQFFKVCLPIPKGYSSHDGWIVKLAEGLNNKLIIDEPFQYYRRHNSNETSYVVNKKKQLKKVHILVDKLNKIYHRRKGTSKFKSKELLNQQNTLLKKRLTSIDNQKIDFLASGIVENFIDVLNEKTNNLTVRESLRSKPILQRLTSGYSLYKDGFYDKNSGIMSYLRDILLR
ncbi:glycosyltransferase family 2 protein [Psychroflexus maritimus]|uniref:Glycosyltransferase family 2 protein n=1 Tax=Psychroflexus maritimus TaxID=2714865 RepID=A0A967ADL1_9FLAO|nr:glycosyltransferase family 2 protein [Psychroflexus maritimus]NGZ90282.1 glycosyltransferase family 2 protein [Psychroflexus maritimus]